MRQIISDNKGAGLRGQLLQTGTDGIRMRAIANQAYRFRRQHSDASKHALAVNHTHGERPAMAGHHTTLTIVLQQGERGLGGVLENLTALAGDRQAQQIITLGH